MAEQSDDNLHDFLLAVEDNIKKNQIIKDFFEKQKSTYKLLNRIDNLQLQPNATQAYDEEIQKNIEKTDELSKYILTINKIMVINTFEDEHLFRIHRKLMELNKSFEILIPELNEEVNNFYASLIDNPNIVNTLTAKKNYNIYIDRTLVLKSELLKYQSDLIEQLSFFKIKIRDNLIHSELNKNKDNFKDETSLLFTEFNNKVESLTNNFKHDIRAFNLEVKKTIDSTKLLNSSVDTGLQDLAVLTQKIQNLELDFNKRIADSMKIVRSELDKEASKLKNDFQNIINYTNERSKAFDQSYEDFKTQVQYAGIYNLTKNYKDKSDEEKTQYKTLRNYTTWSIIAAIASTLIIFIIAFFEHYYAASNSNTNYLLLISRLSISVMFFILALYLSKQAAKHYECFQENHRTFLQLAALDPFIGPMSPEEQLAVRKSLIPYYFNQPSDGKFSSKSDEVDLPANLHAVLNKALDMVNPKQNKATDEKTDESKSV